MATRSIIGVVVNPQDKGISIKPNLEVLGKEINIGVSLDELVFHDIEIDSNTEVIGIYHHNDGDPNYLGKTLLNEFGTYEKVLNLIAFGDASSIIGQKADFYTNWIKSYIERDYQFDPRQYESIQKFEDIHNESLDSIVFLYLFKDGEWYIKFKYHKYGNTDWQKLTEVIDK